MHLMGDVKSRKDQGLFIVRCRMWPSHDMVGCYGIFKGHEFGELELEKEWNVVLETLNVTTDYQDMAKRNE